MTLRWSHPSPALGLCACIAAAAPAAAADPADVAHVLAQMQEASGGARWSSVRTLHLVTRALDGGEAVERDQWEDVATGRFVVAAHRPDGETRLGFDGVTRWVQRRSGIPYTLGDPDSQQGAADESFRVARALWFRDRHPATVALLGQRTEGARTYDVLSVTPASGRPFEVWVDAVTHLLARTDEQEAESRTVVTYADYRAVQGLMIPYLIRESDGTDPNFDEVKTVQSVEVDPKVSDAVYAVPALPPLDASLPDGRESIDVPFRLTADNRVMLTITLDDRLEAEAEFDSGGSLLLQPSTVAKLGVNSGGRHKQGGGGEGAVTAAVGRLKSLTLGGARATGLSFHSFAFSPNHPDDALVGLEILQRFVVSLDFDRMIMTLTRPDAFRAEGRGAVVPFHFQDNQPEVKGSIDGIAGLFTIDTGDDSSLLLIAPYARRYGLAERYLADIPYSGSSVTATHGVWARKRPASVALDGPDGRPTVEVHSPVTRVSLQTSGFDADREVSANIGMGILRQFNLTFDYPRQRLLFQPNHLYGQPDAYNRTGLRLKREGQSWTIADVFPASPAAEAGLKPGDRIDRMDGKGTDGVTDADLAAILKGPVGSTVDLHIVAPSQPRDVRLELRDVI